MNLKTWIIPLVSGALLAACGAPEDMPQVAEPEATVTAPSEPMPAAEAAPSQDGVSAQWTANCAGWENGARTCSWKCRSTSEWLWSVQTVAFGDCGAYANNFCGHSAYKACWSSNKPNY
ncbi:hypothetical protein [Stigmatella erecta]|uniref:Lipoprotein n=1 Tax=Stigmatella erecta TaxID=83460 RepID=A0A1I0K6B2_9BACT|nr:hypothetical protein [Stigmatella erecta]SEU19207.1 hypothetical protein SAMN05443639_109183 [Stigmatella erecta]